MAQARIIGRAVATVLAATVLGGTAAAQTVEFRTPGAEPGLAEALRGASLVRSTLAQGAAPPGDVLAAARAEYGRLLGALYEQGHYSGVISVLIDGREAAGIPVLDVPARIGRVEISVQPGPPFRFARAEVAPLAPGTGLPEGFAIGRSARSGLIGEAARAGVGGWRDAGHALAAPSGQSIIADHAAATLDARIALDPGPRLRFGPLTVRGNEAVRSERIRAIAGLPEGEVFSPADLRRAAERLRRTGAFRSVTLTEAERAGPGDLLPIDALVVEERPRRLGFGAELSSSEGVRLTGYWLHRNLLGGAERLRLGGEIAGIGGDSGGADYRLTVNFARPATFTPDTSLTLAALAERVSDADYTSTAYELSGGLAHVFSDRLEGEARFAYRSSRVEDLIGSRDYRSLSLPVSLAWDGRDDPLNPTRGFYLQGEAMPFLGLGSTGSGLRFTGDARAYRGFGADDRFVLAARLQVGTVIGPTLLETPRDFLFYSGGGGTVRGQEYQSLGVFVLRADQRTGGMNFLGLQSELRARVTDRIGAVAFFDAGYISAVDFGDATGSWHSGAGLGLRYDTGIGPIRLDVGFPVEGGGSGAQVYIGIGQAF